MSNHSPLTNDSIAPSNSEAERQPEGPNSHVANSVKRPAQFLSFWIAIGLPFVHLPLLSQGLGDPSVTLAFFALLVVNVVALYLGHGYNQTA